jgi:hypothetical protein
MKIINVEIMTAPNVRRSLTTPGDVRSDVDFQNDINSLLARIEDVQLPWKAVAHLMSHGIAARPVAQRRRNSVTMPLRILDGGGGTVNLTTDLVGQSDESEAERQPLPARRVAQR